MVVGTNGIGKTHLLKAMYGICEGITNRTNDAYDISQPYFSVNPIELIRSKESSEVRTFIELNFGEMKAAYYSITTCEGKQAAADAAGYNFAIYPLMSVIADHTTGEILGHGIIPFPKYPFIQQQFFWEMLKGMDVRPSKIFVTEETYTRLKPVAKLVGVELVVSELPQLEEFKDMLSFIPSF